jgi:hypothetical protein
MITELPTVTAPPPSSVAGKTVTLGDVIPGLAIRDYPDPTVENHCPYCSGPETA